MVGGGDVASGIGDALSDALVRLRGVVVACRIRKCFDGVGYRDQERWSDLQQELIHAMIKFEHASGPHRPADNMTTWPASI
jgi:hypothetical protein